MNFGLIERTFDDFVSGFDHTEEEIVRKVIHSKNVADNCVLIAESLKMSKEDIFLAYCIGMLHDIARFEQWTLYKNFEKCVYDHALMGVKILFKGNLIERFNIDKKHYYIISFAIKNHLPIKIESTDDGRKLLFAQIVRDADKLDLFKLFDNAEYSKMYKREYNGEGASDKVLEAVRNHRIVNHKDMVTVLDKSLASLCMAYDLNFEYSREIYVQKYLNAVYNNSKDILCAEDLATLQKFMKDQQTFLQKKQDA